MLDIITLPAFNDNYIWLIHKSNSQYCTVVDPGDATPVLNYLQQHSLKLEAILITHHHHDHIGGIDELVSKTSAKVYSPANEDIGDTDYRLHEDDSVYLEKSDIHFSILDVPGHTLGHIAYLIPLGSQNAIFCGDTLFAGGCGRLFEGSAKQMHQSLSKLAALADNTLIYCAHEYTLSNLNFALAVEPDNQQLIQRINKTKTDREVGLSTVPSLLSLEKQTNPFLRCHQNAVKEAAIKRSNIAMPTEIETFATIRQWKDSF